MKINLTSTAVETKFKTKIFNIDLNLLLLLSFRKVCDVVTVSLVLILLWK